MCNQIVEHIHSDQYQSTLEIEVWLWGRGEFIQMLSLHYSDKKKRKIMKHLNTNYFDTIISLWVLLIKKNVKAEKRSIIYLYLLIDIHFL